MEKELIKQLYANGLNAAEIAQLLKKNKAGINKCIQRNFKSIKQLHLKNRRVLNHHKNDVKKILKYEGRQFMSDRAFVSKNRSIYETEKNGDIVLKKEFKNQVTWDTPRKLVNENKIAI